MWLQFLLVPEVRDLRFKIAGQVIVLKQNAVLEGLVPALDLAFGGNARRERAPCWG
jgi:hypothetical protein